MAQENAQLLGLGTMLGTAASSAQGGTPCVKSGGHLSKRQRGKSPGMLMIPWSQSCLHELKPLGGLPEPAPFPILSEETFLGDVTPTSPLGMQL